jgi:predicted ATPase
LRRCADRNFLAAVHEIHGGVPALLASGATQLRIKANAEEGSDRFAYTICLQSIGDYFAIAEETLEQYFNDSRAGREKSDSTPLIRFRRRLTDAQVFFPKKGGKGKFAPARVDGGETLLSSAGLQLLTSSDDEDLAMHKILAAKHAFSDVQIHAAVNTTAGWVARALKSDQPLRQSQELSYSEQLSPTYDNLASVLYGISQGSDSALSRRINESLTLAFGERFEGLRFPPAGAGRIQLHARRATGLYRACWRICFWGKAWAAGY